MSWRFRSETGDRPTVNSRKYQHLRRCYVWSPAEDKGGGSGSKYDDQGPHLHARLQQRNMTQSSRQEQHRSRAVRGDLIPHRSPKAAASGWKRVVPHCRQVALDLALLFPVKRRNGLESWMLKVTARPDTATMPYKSFDDITSPPARVVKAARIAWSIFSDSK